MHVKHANNNFVHDMVEPRRAIAPCAWLACQLRRRGEPMATWVIAFGMSVVWMVSAYYHMINPVAFLDAILQYRLVGVDLARWIAGLLPPLEIAVASWLIVRPMSRLATMTNASLLLLMVGVQSSAWIRGLAIQRGCCGPLSEGFSWQSLMFVSLLFLMSSWLAMRAWTHGGHKSVVSKEEGNIRSVNFIDEKGD